jgi:hypothetical protein
MVRSYCPLCQIVIPPTLIDGHAQAWPRHRLVRVAEPSPETLDDGTRRPVGPRAILICARRHRGDRV